MIDQIQLNQTDSIEIDIFYNGVLTDPTEITITKILDPNGVTRIENQTPNKGDTDGRYIFDVPAAIADTLGEYTAYWQFTINGIGYTHIQKFLVVEEIMDGYVTVSQVRELSTIPEITNEKPSNDIIERHIKKATALVNQYLGGSILYSTYSKKIRCTMDKRTGGILVQMPHRPVNTVTSITLEREYSTVPVTIDEDTGGSKRVISPDNIIINPDSGYFKYTGNLELGIQERPMVYVTYTAGYTYVPDDFTQAVIMIIQELHRRYLGEGSRMYSYELGPEKTVYRNPSYLDGAIKTLGLDDAQGAWNILRNYRQPNKGISITGPRG